MKNEKKRNKELSAVEIIVGLAATVMMLAMMAIAAFLAETQTAVSITMIVVSVVSFIVICLGLTKIEQVVGYYECGKCRHKHVPKYNPVLWSMHIGRTRYMVCPQCHKKSWQKKVL